MTIHTTYSYACSFGFDDWSSIEDCFHDYSIARGFWLKFEEEEENEREERKQAYFALDEQMRALEAERVETYGTEIEQEYERLTDAHMLTGRRRIREFAPMNKRRW